VAGIGLLKYLLVLATVLSILLARFRKKGEDAKNELAEAVFFLLAYVLVAGLKP
jgi:hypothetical protein